MMEKNYAGYYENADEKYFAFIHDDVQGYIQI